MLTFCPNDFNDIDPENLAYELVFTRGRDWDWIKNNTNIGELVDDLIMEHLIEENDKRQYLHFKQNTKIQRVILLELSKKNTKNGLQYLIDKLNEAEEQSDNVFEDEDSSEKQTLYYQRKDHRHLFTDAYNNVIMQALPCCPYCHNPLPIGWDVAEDFAAVSLMAPSGSGKTTLLLSMLYKNWDAFRKIGKIEDGRHRLSITSAHDHADAIYAAMLRNAENMCRRNGECPDNTDREHWIPPLFLNVQFDDHLMIIGLYDNSGENLVDMNLIKNDNLRMLLDKMFAEIFLFDPQDLNISLPEKKAAAIQDAMDHCQILSIENQGIFQKENQDKRITGEELLASVSKDGADDKDVSKSMEVYNNHLGALQQNRCLHRLKEMYFAGVIIKSDLLEHCEEIMSNSEYRPLFDRTVVNDMCDRDSMDMRSDLVERMIKQLRLFGDKDIDDFKEDFSDAYKSGSPAIRRSQPVSWHCISALGCGADSPKNGGKLHGNYAPIRVAEPLVTCIMKRIADNGWME